MDRQVSMTKMTNSLMELADTFGVFAALFTRERQIRHTEWQDGAFRQRENGICRSLCLTLLTGDGTFGQAWTEDWSLSAVQRCFHLARKNARHHPLTLATLQELALQETRLPPMSNGDFHPDSAARLPLEVERLHRQAARHVAPNTFTTTLDAIDEQMHIIRSDGTAHSARVTRLITEHVSFVQQATLSPYRKRTGISLSPFTEWDMQQHVLVLNEQTEHFVHNQSAHQHDERVNLSNHDFFGDTPFWIDMELAAVLLYSWMKSSCDTGASPATIQAVALEGSPGYFPLHPWGYLFPPLTLLSPDGAEPAHLEAVRGIGDFSNHLSVLLPNLLEPILHADQLFEEHPEAVLLEGVEWFAYDEHTGRCCFLPRRIRARSAYLEPGPIELPLNRLLESLCAGAGDTVTAWCSPDALWTASGPRYLLVQPKGGRSNALGR